MAGWLESTAGIQSRGCSIGRNAGAWMAGSGTEWMRRQTQGAVRRDHFQISEYLAAAAPTCRAQAPERWRPTQQDRLKRGALSKVIEAPADPLDLTHHF